MDEKQFDFNFLKMSDEATKDFERKIDEGVLSRISHFAERYPIRLKIAQGKDLIRDDQSNRSTQALINYRENKGTTSPFYGIIHREWCYCGCDKGLESAIVLEINNTKKLNQTISKIKQTTYETILYWGEDIDLGWGPGRNEADKEHLFQISTKRDGCTRHYRRHPDKEFAEASKVRISYSLGNKLIQMLE